MSIPGLSIIAESINDSVPSTHTLFENDDMEAIAALAQMQADKGAAYIDVNVGVRTPALMAQVVKKIQQHVSLPLSIDTPDPEIAAAGLKAYDGERAGNKKPILNSISEARLELFELYAQQKFIPILLATEGKDDSGGLVMNLTAEQTFITVKSLVKTARERMGNINNDQIILDPGIMPIGSDSTGCLKRLLNALQLIKMDTDLSGINISVGLSNFTVMLPPQRADGSPVKSPLESAFLTMAMPLGLNMVVGSMKRNYALLPPGHPAMECLRDVLDLEGIAAIMRVMSFIS